VPCGVDVVVVTVSVDVPEIVMVVGASMAVIVPLFVNESVTVPVKPPTGVTVIVQLPLLPWMTTTGCGVHEVRVKSVTLTVTIVL
jgi:hypothetical protein